MSSVAQRSFQSGELAPSYYANTNLTKYQTGLRTLRNFTINRGGGVTNRPGTEFIKGLKDQTVQGRLIEFSYSDVETYMLELGNGFIRFYQLGVPLAPIGAVPWVNIAPWTAGSIVTNLGVTYYAYMTAGFGAPAGHPEWWYPLSDPTIFEIPTPYTTAELSSLQFAQSKNVMTFVHPAHVPYELSRVGTTGWTMLAASFVPVSATPTGLAIGAGGSAGATTYWAVTAIQAGDFEESLAATASALNRVPSAGAAVPLTWSGLISDFSYNVYRSTDGATYGFIGSSKLTAFSDVGTIPDLLHTFPLSRDLFNAVNKYPSAVTHYQQRRVFANTINEPETVYTSRTARPYNFGVTFPLQDDDAVTFTMVGKKAQPVKHLLDLGILLVLTDREEKKVEGDDAGILRPDAINPRKISANGSSKLRPIEIDDTAIYVQSKGTIVRDLKPVSTDAYQGTDLTVFSQHLFDGFTLVSWDYAKNPHSIVWAARSDGVWLGLTYMRDLNVWGWHRHDTDGFVEDVCVMGELSVDTVYLIVRRVINGVTKRYIERFSPRYFTDQTLMNFSDSAILYNGWNLGATTLTITGGTLWDNTELLTLNASVATFSAGDIGNVFIIRLLDASGNETDRVRFTVTGFTSTTIVTGRVDKIVQAALRAALTTWARALLTVTGLASLEGKKVSVLGDGYVVASPNNSAYPVLTVAGGQVVLPQPYAVIRVGLPYISDFQTLDLDAQGSATIKDKKLLVNKVGLYVEGSRGIWVGQPDGPTATDPLNAMQEFKLRTDEAYSTFVAPKTDYIEIAIESNWGNGRFLVRQVDPLPLSILSANPVGYLPA